MAIEHGPGLKMYFLLKLGTFQPAMLVYQRVCSFERKEIIQYSRGVCLCITAPGLPLFRNMNIRNTRSLDPGTCILWSGHNHLCVQEMTTKWARTTSHKWSYNPAINGLINGFSWGYNPTGIMSSYGKYLDSGPTFWPSKTTIQVEHHRVKTFRIPFFYTTLPPACEKLTRKSKHGASKCSEGFFLFKGLFVP